MIRHYKISTNFEFLSLFKNFVAGKYRNGSRPLKFSFNFLYIAVALTRNF